MIIRNVKNITNAKYEYRTGLYKDENSQFVTMCIKPGETVPRNEKVEIHDGTQYIFPTQGKAMLIDFSSGIINQREIHPGDCIIIPPKSHHGIINIGSDDFKFYTIYSPVEHPEL